MFYLIITFSSGNRSSTLNTGKDVDNRIGFGGKILAIGINVGDNGGNKFGFSVSLTQVSLGSGESIPT